MSKRAGSLRDELITKARYGQITPEEAEAQVKAAGLPPFASQPEFTQFDPMKESRWTLVMAIAWIAWRDPQLVMEQGAEFRSQCRHWIFQQWNEPVGDGHAFASRSGWSLETWHEATAVRLTFEDAWLRASNELPSSARLTPTTAQKELWHALAEGTLVAEGFDSRGQLVEIPPREWVHLKLFEAGERDVLRYDALNRREPYTKVCFRRVDLIRLWPHQAKAEQLRSNASENLPIEPHMLAPILERGSSYVPLCAALHWISSKSGTQLVMLNDAEAWRSAVAKLWPLICSGEIELIGLRSGSSLAEPIPGHSVSLVKVLPPLAERVADMLVSAPSHVSCSLYLDEQHWQNGSNDQLFESGRPYASWTHLQIRGAKLLARWPKPDPVVEDEAACVEWLKQQINDSPDRKPWPKAKYQSEALKRYPIGKNQFLRAWDKAIAEAGAYGWSKPGRPASKIKSPRQLKS